MKIAYISPGSGDNFYCQNCFRDDDLLTTLLLLGQDVHRVPMYLPSGMRSSETIPDTPVFYGAINVYLREKLPLYQYAPTWLEKAFDSQSLLQYAAKKSGSTRATGLEEMTISMLQGEEGRHAEELDNLIQYLQNELKPDVVHLSNALLLGLAHRLKHDLEAKVACSLQDENEWVDEMEKGQQDVIWNLMADKGLDVDVFIATSQFYSQKAQSLLKILENKIKVINGGINLDGYEASHLPVDPPVIGYLCRMSEYFGLGIMVDAFIELKKNSPFKNLRLHMTGGYTGDDKTFVDQMVKKISNHGYEKDIQIFEEFDKASRIRFLKSLTLLSVPVPSGEAFGAYQVEALASGVPVVQPNVGCYPEFVAATNGGLIYEPNDGKTLAKTIAALLADPSRIHTMAEQGRQVVLDRYSIEDMAKNMVRIYEDVIGTV